MYDDDAVPNTDWVESSTHLGKSYYYNKITKVTQWITPIEYIEWKDLALKNWLMSTSSQWRQARSNPDGTGIGRAYYYTLQDRTPQWQPPEAITDYLKYLMDLTNKRKDFGISIENASINNDETVASSPRRNSSYDELITKRRSGYDEPAIVPRRSSSTAYAPYGGVNIVSFSNNDESRSKFGGFKLIFGGISLFCLGGGIAVIVLAYAFNWKAYTTTTSPSAICTDSQYNNGLLGGGCSRYYQGYDITGVTNQNMIGNTTVITSSCDCMLQCKQTFSTCTSWVWKYTEPSQQTRQCILYSNFNLPPGIVVGINTSSSINTGVIAGNPQIGGQVPPCTMDGLVTGIIDTECVSGTLFYLDNDSFMC